MFQKDFRSRREEEFWNSELYRGRDAKHWIQFFLISQIKIRGDVYGWKISIKNRYKDKNY